MSETEGICAYCGGEGVNGTDPDVCIDCLVKRQHFRKQFSKSDIENQKFTVLLKDALFEKGIDIIIPINLPDLNEVFQDFLSKPEFSQILITKRVEATNNKVGISREAKKN